MKTLIVFQLIALMIFYGSPLSSIACTEFRVETKDKSVIIGRSMEFAQDLDSSIIVQPRGQQRSSEAPGGREGTKWTSKYGVVYLNGFGLDIAADGINEKGLSVGSLYFPDDAKYQDVPSGKESEAISQLDLPLYILQNFATVDEVREALPKLIVWGKKLEVLGNIVVPLHWGVYEAGGKGIVLEYTREGLNIYDNIGVMTNSPAYPWHITNIMNYVNLTADNIRPVVINGISFASAGQGSGLKGIPGDPTPPSRFIRAGAMVHLSEPVDTALEGVNLAAHILNTVDIPIGIVRDFRDKRVFHDHTQWVVVKDLTNKILYYRSYGNLTIRSIDLRKLDFAPEGKRLSIPVHSDDTGILDITSELKASN